MLREQNVHRRTDVVREGTSLRVWHMLARTQGSLARVRFDFLQMHLMEEIEMMLAQISFL